MLEVGNGGLTLKENKAHFSLWSILAAPLMLGNDVRDMTLEVWRKELADGSRAVVLLNRSEAEADIAFSWTESGYPEYLSLKVRDLWQHEDLGTFDGSRSARVPSHGVVMLTVQ